VFLPIYVRGLVYLRAKQGKEAAAEFQRILNYRALGAIAPAYALSQVGVARAYALTGDLAKSRNAYQDFFALWKDADSDVPILKEAKAEYTKLQEGCAPTQASDTNSVGISRSGNGWSRKVLGSLTSI